MGLYICKKIKCSSITASSYHQTVKSIVFDVQNHKEGFLVYLETKVQLNQEYSHNVGNK